MVTQLLMVLLLFVEAGQRIHHTKRICLALVLLALLKRLGDTLTTDTMLLRLGIGHLLGKGLVLLSNLGLVLLLRQILESNKP